MSGSGGGAPQENRFVLDRTESFTMRGHATGDDYRLDLALPEGEPPAEGWPVLYLLDSTGSFGTCVEALRRMGRRPDATGVRPMAVAGISASNGYDTARRQRDYTTIPTDREVEPGANGGAAIFLDFIENEVRPEVAGRLPLDTSRQTLCGHSLAGFFTLWALTARPAAFRNYAAISPSIWWDKTALMDGLARLSPRSNRVFMTVGEWEDALPPWQLASPGSDTVIARRAARRMVEGAAQVAQSLETSLGPGSVDFSILPEEDHASIISTAIPRILRFTSLA
ncbi:MAG TPA: alpha/beta hydrolase-fold protein [Croceibacterium sp.]|nr:alpha/beta hydrolase-fold protein [Croceibacterium sp.]